MNFFESLDDFTKADEVEFNFKTLQNHHKVRERAHLAKHNIEPFPPPDQELLELREKYSNDYVAVHQEIFKASTGERPLGETVENSVKHTQHVINNGGRLLKLEPRGFGKTARSCNEAIMAVLQGKIRYALILGSSVGKANEMIDAIKTELVENEKLYELYPTVCECFRRLDESPIKSRYQMYDGDLTYIGYGTDKLKFPILPGEVSSGAVIQVRPKDNVRGTFVKIKSGPMAGELLRPDFVFLDDIQTDEEAHNPNAVRKIVNTIKKSVLMASSHSRPISAVMSLTPICPGDVAHYFALEEASWELVAYSMMHKMPSNMSLWLDEYGAILNSFDKTVPGSRIRAQLEALEFFKEHYDEMMAGAKAAAEWAYGYKRQPQTEINAVQHAMNIIIEEGMSVFETECQCKLHTGEQEDDVKAPTDSIMSKLSPRERTAVGVYHTKIVTHIDVNKDILTYVTCSSPPGLEPEVIDYGTYPDQKGVRFTKQKMGTTLKQIYSPKGIQESNLIIAAALRDLLTNLSMKEYIREDGVIMKNDAILVDSPYEQQEVFKVCRELRLPCSLVPYTGIFVGAKDKPIAERNYQAGCEKHHNCVLIPSNDNRLRVLHSDVNYMKTEVHRGFRIPFGQPGSISLFIPEWTTQHSLLADHCNAEFPVNDYDEKMNRHVTLWKSPVHQANNEFFDNLAGCLAGLSMLGCQFRVESKPESKRIDLKQFYSNQKAGVQVKF